MEIKVILFVGLALLLNCLIFPLHQQNPDFQQNPDISVSSSPKIESCLPDTVVLSVYDASSIMIIDDEREESADLVPNFFENKPISIKEQLIDYLEKFFSLVLELILGIVYCF